MSEIKKYKKSLIVIGVILVLIASVTLVLGSGVFSKVAGDILTASDWNTVANALGLSQKSTGDTVTADEWNKFAGCLSGTSFVCPEINIKSENYKNYMLNPGLSGASSYGILPGGFGNQTYAIHPWSYVPLSGSLCFEGAMEPTLNSIFSRTSYTESDAKTLFSATASKRIEYMKSYLADGANLRVVLKDASGSKIYIANEGSQAAGSFKIGLYLTTKLYSSLPGTAKTFVGLTSNIEYINSLNGGYYDNLARIGARYVPKDKLINRGDIQLIKTISVSGLAPFEIKEIDTGIDLKNYCVIKDNMCLRFAVADINDEVIEKNELDNVDMMVR